MSNHNSQGHNPLSVSGKLILNVCGYSFWILNIHFVYDNVHLGFAFFCTPPFAQHVSDIGLGKHHCGCVLWNVPQWPLLCFASSKDVPDKHVPNNLELPDAAGQVLADASSARVCQQSSQDLVAECGEWLWAEAHEPSWPYCSPGYLSCTRFRADWSLFVNGRAVDGCHVPVCAQAARAFWNGSDKDLPFLLDFLLRDLPQQHTASVTRLQPLSVNLRKMVYRMSSWVCFFGTLPPRSLGMIPGPVDCLLALSCKVHNPTVGFGPLMLFRMNSW